MSRLSTSALGGCVLTLVLWALSRLNFLEPTIAYLLFPGEAAGALLFGHEHASYFIAVAFGANTVFYSALCYVLFRITAHRYP